MTPCGEANVDLTVDQATADVPVLIVPNESQAIPVIVGQPFTEQPHVMIVRRRDTVRIFEQEKNVDEGDDTLQSIEIPDLPRRPVFLWAKDSTVVPPNYVGFVELYVTGSEPNADVFADAQLRCQEGCEHCIPRCVVNVDAANETCIPVMNVSYQVLNIKANERVARAEVCYFDEEPMQDVKSSCSATQPCSTASANVKTGPSVTPEHREKLDRLIEEYRDCFADSVAEIGRTNAAEMKIETTAQEPVRYRPYRLSFADIGHAKVITDRGTAFTSAKFKATCDAFSIKHMKNATAMARANGQVERYNRMITPAVASLTKNTDGKDWDTTLPQVQWGINNTLHQAAKTTPFGLLFNYRPQNINADCVDDALAEEFDRQVEAKRTSAAESIHDDQRKQQARYNKKRSEAPTYEPGDVVLVEREPTACGESRKLKEKYRGPYVIMEKLPND